MRIDVKTVKKRSYVQFIDRNGHRYHLGSVEDFDSWYLAILFWCQQLEEETAIKRKMFFDDIDQKIGHYKQLSDIEKSAIGCTRIHYSTNRLRLKLLLPKMEPFVELKENKGKRIWSWNSFGVRLRPRIRELYFERRRFNNRHYKVTKDNPAYKIRERNIEAYNYVHSGPYSIPESKQRIFYLIKEKTGNGRFVREYTIANALKAEIDPSLTRLLIRILLAQGIIYQPRIGVLGIPYDNATTEPLRGGTL